MFSLGSNILSLIVEELEVREAVQLQRCCWYLYKRVIIATNDNERFWLRLLQVDIDYGDRCHEPLLVDNLKWFVAMVKISDVKSAARHMRRALFCDAITCAMYIWDKYALHTSSISEKFEIYLAGENGKYCKEIQQLTQLSDTKIKLMRLYRGVEASPTV